ncbi:MAG TPA: FkbM family methyltransferase [Flavobacteriales bacterium]|nr:FkbM family methyltransferase [Flavobacteriales bacterium]
MKELLYKILDLLMLGRGIRRTISGTSIRLPTRYFRYYPANYERDSMDFFRKHVKPGNTVIDVGAQFGLMSKTFADLVTPGGKVFAFEPSHETFNLLKKTIAINRLEKYVFPVEKGIAHQNGKAGFMVSDTPADSANTLSPTKRTGNIRQVEIILTSIDQFKIENIISKIDFIKIDAEGAEMAVLEGASQTAINDRPLINLALHPKALADFGSSLNGIYKWIINHGYTIYYKNEVMAQEKFTQIADLFDVQLIPNEQVK